MTSIAILPAASGTTIALTAGERGECAILAGQLAGAPHQLIDTPEWVEAARRLSCRLPLRIRELARRYLHDPGPDGLLVIGNLPVDECDLPPTPTAPDSAERRPTGPAALAALITLQLGEIAAYRQEKAGALVQNVVPVPGRERTQSNAGSTLLELHVENAFHARRPDLIGLLCLRSDHAGTAGTLVSSIRRAMPLLSAQAAGTLRQPRFVTSAPPSFATAQATAPHAVLDADPRDPDILVDFAATSALDPDAALALGELSAALLEVSRSLVLRPGEMAFLDNRITLHGRTAFTPRYDGRDRWLHRTYVHLDRRRTREYREPHDYVLS
jgi:L-asparagine oxygenase